MKGSIQKFTGKRGVSWYAVVDLGPDPVTGKRRQKRVSAPTRKACEERVRETIRIAEQGGMADAGKMTVREYLDRWLPSIEPTLRPSTHRRYSDLMRQHVVPVLGSIRLVKLSPLDVQRLYADRLAAGLSPTSVHQIHNVLHRALKQAVRWGMVNRNVTEAVDAPRPANPEYQTWDAKQVAAVFAVGDETELAALWRLALLTGMRRGELLGLMWPDVDLERGVLAVRRTRSRGTGGTWVFGAPKTAGGRRSIALPPSAVESLRHHRLRQLEQRLALGDAWEDCGIVFANESGAPLHVNSLAGRFRKLIATAGVPKIRFHDLRHTSATLMLLGGEHPKIVAERLGHSDVSITLNRYSHVSADMQCQAADRLDAMIEQAS
ncbi:MAG TPA: tyrosine-type recombinase/integrase [Thermomicrobiales bacterium]|nr:tyrosine-type recombinase/integrase [Thermomicrobiales bacterium]